MAITKVAQQKIKQLGIPFRLQDKKNCTNSKAEQIKQHQDKLAYHLRTVKLLGKGVKAEHHKDQAAFHKKQLDALK